MQITGSVALVTGANRGLGRTLVDQLLEAGAAKVYAAARDVSTIEPRDRVVPIRLDLLDPASVDDAARVASDVTLLVNNAGIDTHTSVLTGTMADVRREFETNTFGTLTVTRTFAPVLERNGGTVLTVLSALSWITFPTHGAYAAAKSASWSITNALRLELQQRGVHVAALHVAYMDTDMTAGIDAPKTDPEQVARIAVAGLAEGLDEILADDTTRRVKAGLSADPSVLYGATR